MRKCYLLTFVLSIVLAGSVTAQKAEQLKNSYNFKRALEILQNDGERTEAMDYLQKELAEHPKNGYAYYMIGSLYYNADMPGEAIEPTNKAISLLQKDKEWITYAYRQRANINLKLGKEKDALNDWSLSLKADPKDVNTYYDRAEYYYMKDMYAESDADFDRICKLEPGKTLGFMGKGRNAMENQRYQEAMDLFSYCMKLDPSFSQPYAFRAETYFGMNRFNDCIDDIVKALGIDTNKKAIDIMMLIGEPYVDALISKLKVEHTKQPDSALWPYYIGIVSYGQKDYTKAIEAFKETIAIDPNDAIYYCMADCYSELGDYDLALSSIDQAIELDPNDADHVGMKADLLYDMGRGDEAVAAYDEYIKANPEYFGGYYRRGYLKDNLKDTDGAIEDYSTAITLNPTFAYAYLGRADKYLLKGNREAAMKDYQMVIAIDTIPGESNCAQYAYLGIGDVEKAKSFEYAILANSASAGNYYDAACLFARMGDRDAAVAYLRNSLEKGFTRFAHIKNDDDLDAIRDMQSYKDIMNTYETKYIEEQNKKRKDDNVTVEREERVSEVPFTVEGGNYYVKCQINELPMRFVFDTGASDVSISMVEASFMMKNGYLSKKDVIGSAHFSDAVGNVSEGTVINLKKVKFGDMELDNVRASVVRNQKAPLLLGQTVLSRIGKIEIDNQRKVIKIKYSAPKFEAPIIHEDDIVKEAQ